MGLYRWYREHILPRGVNRAMRGKQFDVLRPSCIGGARGRVLELGFGSGLNLPFYGEGVEELLAIDPATVGRKLAGERMAAAPFPVRFVDLDGDRLPLDDASVDCVTSTWTLCSIPGVEHTLAEVARVLRPGGTLRFLEHGCAREERVARWQRRLTPIQKIWAGGCRLDLPIDLLVEGAGIGPVEHEEFWMEGPKIFSWLYRGVATKGPAEP